MKKIALFSVLLLLIGASAFAGPLPYYGVAKLGAYTPEANDVEDFDTSFYGEIAVGYYFHKNFAGEFGVGYTKSSADRNGFNADLTVIPITAALKGVLPMGVFEPYALAGIGAYYVTAKGSSSLGSFDTDDTAFGYFLGLGANFNITKDVFFGLEGKYFWVEPNLEGGDQKIDGSTLTANIGLRY